MDLNLFARKKTAKELWDQHREEFIKIYAAEQLPSFNNTSLEKRFIFSDGRQVYGYPVSLALPVERFGKLKEFMMWMSSGLNGSELDKMLDIQEKALAEGVSKSMNAAIIGSVITEMRNRKKMVIHSELIYNYIAVQLVVDGEDPGSYNNEQQMLKVEYLKKETESGNGHFFFQLPELKRLQDLYNMSDQEWREYWSASQVAIGELEETIKFLQQKIRSENPVKI